MTALPSEINVGPFAYTVDTDRVALNEQCRDQGADLLGACDHRTRVIHIDDTVHTDVIADTLIHESLHAIVSLVGFSWPIEREEAIINRLSPALLGWIRDNPALVKYLVT